SESGLKVCFGQLRDTDFGAPAVLDPVPLPTGPFQVGPVRCDRCHIQGRRLSLPLVPNDSRSDRYASATPLLNEVTEWYRAATRKGKLERRIHARTDTLVG